MSVYSIVENLLLGIPGTILAAAPNAAGIPNANLYSPEHPQTDDAAALPTIKVRRISSNAEYSQDGLTRVQTSDRVQITMTAETQTGLNVLIGQVHAVMSHHYPFLGSGPDGNSAFNAIMWSTADWLIIY